MKFTAIKTLNVTLIISITILSSCFNMKNQAEEVINANRVQMMDEIEELQQQNIITQSEAEQLGKRLNQDLDYYIEHQDMDTLGIENLFQATVKSFENIKINESVFSVIQSAYHNIAGQLTMRDYPQIDMSIQPYISNMLHRWFDQYQTEDDKLTDLISRVKRYKALLVGHSDISAAEYDAMIHTITQVKEDTSMSTDELKKIVVDGMIKHANKSNDSNLEILNIYDAISRIKKLGIYDELLAIYHKNYTEPEEPSYAEMKQEVSERFKILLKEDMINRSEYELYTQTILSDIEFCEHSETDSKEKIKEQLLKGLAKLKDIGETEEREAVAEWYFTLSQKKDIDIANNLNEWMYF